jgi:transposase InsO family protein
VLQVAPSAYRRHAARQRNPELRSARAKRDELLMPHIERVWHANMQVYGAEKVWKQMNREDIAVARCTVERLMRQLGLEGVRRGKKVRTTVPDTSAPCPLDRVNRQFQADRPNQLWVSDFVRHEAPCKRVEVEDLYPLAVAAAGEKLRAARPRRCGGRVESSPDKAVTGWHC